MTRDLVVRVSAGHVTVVIVVHSFSECDSLCGLLVSSGRRVERPKGVDIS